MAAIYFRFYKTIFKDKGEWTDHIKSIIFIFKSIIFICESALIIESFILNYLNIVDFLKTWFFVQIRGLLALTPILSF